VNGQRTVLAIDGAGPDRGRGRSGDAPCGSVRELRDRLLGAVDAKRTLAALRAALHGLEAAARAGDHHAYATLEKVVDAWNAPVDFGCADEESPT
jgi:hypothetical protein